MTRDEVSTITAALAGWAGVEPSCRALALVGSWSRDEARADSDLDVLFLMDDPARWRANHRWLDEIAHAALGIPAARTVREQYGVAYSWRLWFGPAVEVEATVVGLSWAAVTPADPGARRVVADGMTILVDKDGLLSKLQSGLVDAKGGRT